MHPHAPLDAATRYYRSVAELPGAPDAAFIAVPEHRGAGAWPQHWPSAAAGGFVCFSAGFSETGTDAGGG